MNKREKNKYTMYKTIENVLTESQETVNTTPALSLVLKDFQAAVAKIAEVDQKYISIAEGATQTKDTAEAELIESMLAVVGITRIFARRNQNEQLAAMTQMTISDLRLMRDADLLQKSKTLLEQIEANLTGLTELGMEAEIFEKFKADIESYDTAFNNKDAKLGQSKSARQELTEMFSQTDEILKEELDYVMDYVKTKDQTLFNDYQASRTIKDV
jgi:hypothetical protein